MLRSDLIASLASANPDIPRAEIERLADTFFAEIVAQLAKGGRVELRGFGVFSTRARAARTARNPRTGDAVEVPDRRAPFFRAGREIKTRLNG